MCLFIGCFFNRDFIDTVGDSQLLQHDEDGVTRRERCIRLASEIVGYVLCGYSNVSWKWDYEVVGNVLVN